MGTTVHAAVGRILGAAVAAALMAALCVAAPAAAVVPSDVTLTRTSWDVIGLDSNTKSWAQTPRRFPVSRRVCNTTAAPIADVTAALSLGEGEDTEIRVPSGWPTTLDLGTLAPVDQVGACREATFAVVIGEGHTGEPKDLLPDREGDTRRNYTLSVHTPAGVTNSLGQLYVEALVSQNRNQIDEISSAACADGVCTVLPGEVTRFVLKSGAASNGFDQTQSQLDLPLNIVDVLDVQTTYTKPQPETRNGVYGDGCQWEPSLRKCTQSPAPGIGGVMVTTYTVRGRDDMSAGASAPLSALIYDVSGSSFHYNNDYVASPQIKTMRAASSDLGVSVTAPDTAAPGSDADYLVTIGNAGPSQATDVIWSANLPSGVTFAGVFTGETGDTAVADGVCSASDGVVTCTISALDSGVVVAFRLRLTIGEDVADPAKVTVTVDGAEPDPNPVDNTAADETCIACAKPPVVTFADDAATSVTEHATTRRTYAFTATHPRGVDLLTTSCGDAGERVGGTVDGEPGATERTGTVVCVFDDGATDRTSAVTVTATNGEKNSGKTSVTVAIANAAPTATLGAPLAVEPGGSFTLQLTGAADASAADKTAGFTYRFDCGGGAGDWTATASATCTAPKDALTVAVAGWIRDKDGGSTSSTRTLPVVLPATISFTGEPETTVTEGADLRTYRFSASHPSGVHVLDAACGTGELVALKADDKIDETTRTGTVQCRFDDGVYADGIPTSVNVTVTATPVTGNAVTVKLPVKVTNVAPNGTIVAPTTVDAGSTFTLALTDPADPSGDDTERGFGYRFDCGSGSFGEWGSASSVKCEAPDDDSSVTVRIEIRDKEGDSRELSRSVKAELPTGVIAFTNPPRETMTGTATASLTVQLRDADGEPLLAGVGGKLLRLHSSSATGTFHTADPDLTPLTTVTVPQGADAVAFRYRDTAAGTPTITVYDQADLTKDLGLGDASQKATVYPAAKSLVLDGASDTLMVGATRTFTAKIVDAGGATVTTGPDATAAITFSQVDGKGAVTGLAGGSATSGGVATVTVTGDIAGSVTLRAATTVLAGGLTSSGITFPVKTGGRLTAGTVKFPATPLNTTTSARSVTVTNTGDEPVTVTGAALTGGEAADFAIVEQACGTLAPGASCTISLTMTPSVDGTRRTTLRLVTAGGDLDIAVEGIGGSGNRAPSLRITITPERPLTTETVKADVEATDPDGDGVTLSYTWTVNGVQLQRLAKTSSLSDAYNLKPQGSGDVSNLVTVVVTATDGVATTTATKTVRVANSAPEARDRSSVAREGGVGVAIPLNGVDPDDQTLRYTITSLPGIGALWVGGTQVTEPGFVVRVKEGNTDLFPSTVTYVPPSKGTGITSFTYSAADADPVQPLKSDKDGKVTISVFTSPGTETKVTSDNDTAVEWKPSTSDNPVPVETKVDAGRSGLGISINEVGISKTDEDTIVKGSTYRLLDVKQEVHIYTLVENNGTMEEGPPAQATHANPFVLTFKVIESLLPEGSDPDEVIIYRNTLAVPACEDGFSDTLVDGDGQPLPLPQDEEPCWSDRDSQNGILTITVKTLQASQWNFAAPEGAPDTAILSGYQGVTSAGSANDPGAPNAPEGGTLEGFSFSSNEPDATFECQLTGPGGAHQHEFEDCTSGEIEYDVSGSDHPDGLYIFEVRAVNDGVEDGSPARRDFVIDRSEVSITLDEAPESQHPSTTAEFVYSSNKPGTEFECMIRLQTAVGGAFDDCDEDFVASGLTRGAAYEFNVRGTDEAGNTGQVSTTFTITPDATPPVVPVVDDDDDPEIIDPGVSGSAPSAGGKALERIAGPDRISTAAELALRYFSPGLPAVYVARSDTFPDALTGGPLAAADGAPILLVRPRRVPEETAAALRHLRPGRIVILGGTVAVTPEVQERLGLFAPEVDRVSGPDRFGTAAQISRTLYPRGSSLALISTGLDFPDALGAGAAAAALGGPVLLVSDQLPAVTAAELVRLKVKRVLVIGGPRAVSPQLAARIAALTGATVERISGPTRYDTAARLSETAFPPGTPAAFIATGETFVDALTAAPVAAKLGSPLLIVQPRRLPPGIAAELGRVRPTDVLLLGGTNAVATEVELAINDALS